MEDEISRYIEDKAERVVDIKLLPYINDRKQLLSYMAGVNLCMTLSWHEGFGLTAWEAIGAGIPLIISKNTGVYELLHDVGGSATGCVLPVNVKGSYEKDNFRPEDAECVVEHIAMVANAIDKHLDNAKSLQRWPIQV
jgi:glycosyltransferase involved in cell wall biosynthesis